MAITNERLRQTFSEGGAQEIYRGVRATGDFLGFARRYVFDSDYRVAMEIAYYKPAVKCLRKRILSGKFK